MSNTRVDQTPEEFRERCYRVLLDNFASIFVELSGASGNAYMIAPKELLRIRETWVHQARQVIDHLPIAEVPAELRACHVPRTLQARTILMDVERDQLIAQGLVRFRDAERESQIVQVSGPSVPDLFRNILTGASQ